MRDAAIVRGSVHQRFDASAEEDGERHGVEHRELLWLSHDVEEREMIVGEAKESPGGSLVTHRQQDAQHADRQEDAGHLPWSKVVLQIISTSHDHGVGPGRGNEQKCQQNERPSGEVVLGQYRSRARAPESVESQDVGQESEMRVGGGAEVRQTTLADSEW